MSVSEVIAKIVTFLRAGYPQGVPATDTFPLLALLRRQLSDEEVVQIATELAQHGDLPVEVTDIRVMITKITDQMPSPDEVERVKRNIWRFADGPSATNSHPPSGAASNPASVMSGVSFLELSQGSLLPYHVIPSRGVSFPVSRPAARLPNQ
jgi:Protein of unknown function (DUF3349)